MPKYRILSIDGGGIRGIVPVLLLERLGIETGRPDWLDSVDLVAGTSTGGLIALALAAGKSLAEIRDIYDAKGAEIFDRSLWRMVTHLGSLIGAKYDLANLEKVVRPFFGEHARLGDLKKRVLIASFDLDSGGRSPTKRTWKPKLFHNFPLDPGNDRDEFVYKTALYTSAAPTYFPPRDGYVDGGVYAANPSMCALAQTQDPRIQECPAIADVVLLSLGTGISLQHIAARDPDWGDAQWIEPLLAIMLDGISGIADFQCDKILGSRYQRLAPVFPAGTSVAMDDAAGIELMTKFASAVDLTSAADWLRENWL